MKVRITKPAIVTGRTLAPGLTIDLPEIEAQRILALGNAVALGTVKTPAPRNRKSSTDAAA